MTQETPPKKSCPVWADDAYEYMSIRTYTAILISQALVTNAVMSPKIIAKKAILIADAILTEIDDSTK